MEAILFSLAIICLFIGWLISRIEYKELLKTEKSSAYDQGFDDGFGRAFEDAGAVRRAYQYHFETRS